MSTRFQITLPDDLAADLKEAAASRGVPLAQFIRETTEEILNLLRRSDRADPFSWMNGLAATSETDLAGRIDEILCHEGKRVR